MVHSKRRHAGTRSLGRRLAALLFVPFLAAAAQAQAIDFVLNLDDTGFDPVIAGANVQYVATVTELNGDPTAPTTLTLQLPSGLTATGTSGTITGCTPALPQVGPVTLTCAVPALAANGQATLTLVARATARGTRILTASIPTAGDADPDNNLQTEQTTVNAGADLALDVAGPSSVAAGGQATLSYTVTNNGPDPTSSFTLQIPRPTGLVVTTPPSGCTLSGSTYSCAISTPLAAGASLTRTLVGQVAVARGSSVAALGAVIPGTPGDAVASNNNDSTSFTVTAGSDLRIGKARSPSGTLTTGQAVTFTLTPTFTGDVPGTVTVTDTVPASYAITGVTASAGWSCSVAGQLVTCTRAGTGAPGADVSLGTIAIATTAAAAGTPTNRAQVSASGPLDPNLSNNEASDGGATIQAPNADLRATKSGPSPALGVIGNSYQFRLGAGNVGNVPFFGRLVLTDELPAGFRATALSGPGWDCSGVTLPAQGPTSLTCFRDYTSSAPLAIGAATPTLTLTATATAAGTQPNSAVVSSVNPNAADGDPGNDRATAIIANAPGGAEADVAVVKTAAGSPVAVGDPLTFRIEVTNAGPSAAQSVIVTDTLSGLINNGLGATGQGVVSITPIPGAATGVTCSSATDGATARRLSCTVGTLPVCTPGTDCPVIEVAVRPGGEAGARTNTADATSFTTADPNLANNGGGVGFTVTPRADLDVVKAGAPSPVPAGQVLTYTVTARNAAGGGQALSTAAGVQLTDTLPAGVVFLSSSIAGGGACGTQPAAGSVTGPGNDALVCALGSIATNAQRAVTVQVRPTTALANTTITNQASVTTTTPQVSTANNATTLATRVDPPRVDLQINKTDSPDPVAVGDLVTYRLVARNNGPSAAEDVLVTDTLPTSRLSFDSVVPPTGGTCTGAPAVGTIGGTVTCDVGDLAAGAEAVVLVRLRGVAKGVTVNAAEVTSNEGLLGFETQPSNNSVTEDTTVRTRADMEVVSKVALPSSITLPGQTTFTITVRNNTGAGLAEADNVVVTDSLPAGLRLRGTPTIAVTSGTVQAPACTGAAGATSFTCPVGTVSSGAVFEISVPVDAIRTVAQAQVITNTASVTTTSLDVNGGNNSNSGAVVVSSSSVAGTVFRDFDDDQGIDAGRDTGIAGITVTLTGTDVDGNAVPTRTTTTDASGNFLFQFLPAGTYAVSHGAITEPYLTPGTNVPGTADGTVASATRIEGIDLGRNEAATGYLFPKIPQARVGIAKAVQGTPTVNADGSFLVTFRLRVTNLSLEPLSGVTVTDALSGAAPGFGTLQASGALAAGSYRVTAAPSGSCGGLNAAFDGSGDATVLSGATLAAGATCTADVTLRVQPTVPLPPVRPSTGRYENQAAVDAAGAFSGQTSATNPQLADLSDNGVTADPDGDGQANEPGENDPTPVAPNLVPAIALVKAADASGLSSPPRPGDVIAYAFTVTNTGTVTLTDVTVADPLPGLTVTGGPVTLAPGQSDATTFTASYAITQADIDAGRVVNQATATGRNGLTSVTDPSGSTVGNNTPTTTPIAREPRLELVKSLLAVDDINGNGRRDAGDLARWGFAVTNTGNVRLGNVTLTDGGATVAGSLPTLEIGATNGAALTASRTLTQADVDRGFVENSATAAARALDANDAPILSGGSPLTATDVSDTGTAPDGTIVPDPAATETPDGQGGTDGDPTQDPTVAVLPRAPGIVLVKSLVGIADTNGSGRDDAGDTVTYAFAVTNTGNLALAVASIDDPLVSVTGGPVTIQPGATDSGTFTASYLLTPADQGRLFVENSASVTGSAVDGGGAPILDTAGDPVEATDVSDSGTAPDGSVVADPASTETPDGAGATNGDPGDDPTVAPLRPSPALSLVKSLVAVTDADGDGLPEPGDVASYAFAVTNTGNTALAGVTVADPLATVTGGPVDLAVGGADLTTFTAIYVLTQADLDRGFVENRATATGTAETADGDPILDGAGDPLEATDLSDAGTAPDGSTVTDPESVETPDGSGATDGDPTQDPTVATLGQGPRLVLVKSLDGVTDTTGDGLIGAGDTVRWAFRLTNLGNVALSRITLTDPDADTLAGGPIDLAPGESDDGSFEATTVLTQADVDAGGVQNVATATGDAVTAGGAPILVGGAPLTVSDASDAGTAPDGSIVPSPGSVETPDLAGGTNGDPGDDPTVALVAPVPRIELVKSVASLADTNGSGRDDAGDTVTYAFTVTNTGNLALAGVTISDPLVSVAGGPVDLAVGGSDATSFTATYVLTAADQARGWVENSALAEGAAVDSSGAPILDGAGEPLTATDRSDAGTDPTGAPVATPGLTETPDGQGGTDGDPTQDPTVVRLEPSPALSLVKSLVGLADTTGDGLIGVGDTASYAFRVANRGNVALQGVTVTDPRATVAGGPVDLPIGGSDDTTFTATLVIAQSDVNRGFVENSAIAAGAAVDGAGDPLLDPDGEPLRTNDVSDAGTAPDGTAVADPEATETPDGQGGTDGDPTQDPTVALLAPAPGVVLVKSLLGVDDVNGNGLRDAGDVARYGFAVTNTGNLDLSGIAVADPLAAVSGGPIALVAGATDEDAFTASYALTQADVDRGFVENRATVTGTASDPGETPVSDLSDSGTDPTGAPVADPGATETPDGLGGTDGDPSQDPTVAVIEPVASIALVKTADASGFGPSIEPGDVIRYGFAVTNTGTVTLFDVTLADALPGLVLTGGPIPSLAPGETDRATFAATYALTEADIERGRVENRATATGSGGSPGGPAVTDDSGTDDGGDGPTVVELGRPEIRLDIVVVRVEDLNGNGVTDAGDRVVYGFVVTNTGNTVLTAVDIAEGSLSLPLDLVCAPVTLAPGESATLSCTGAGYLLTQADVDRGEVVLSGTAEGTGPTGLVVTDPSEAPAVPAGGGALTLTKLADRSDVLVGEVVGYTITVTSDAGSLPVVATLVDVLPEGFAFVEGSARLDGVAVEPAVEGGTLRLEGVAIGPGETVTLTLDALVTQAAEPGSHVNVARLLSGATGRDIAPEATAAVRLGVEPVFDCATVLGRVFEDLNQDGAMNGAGPVGDNPGLTDQSYDPGEKFGLPEAPPGPERGLAGVRLVTPDGIAVTTDEHGRYSLPCAALPRAIGSNVSLRLDERTLPAGYRVTTENPRVVRVTPGMLTRADFGAALSRVVRIDLSARAFAEGEPRPELVEGLRAMVAELAGTPTVLRLTYADAGEGGRAARARLDAVESLVRRLWPEQGRTGLLVERSVRPLAANE